MCGARDDFSIQMHAKLFADFLTRRSFVSERGCGTINFIN